MLFYPAALPLSCQALDYTAGIIHRHRKQIGSGWRELNPGRQALLVLAHLRMGETFAEMGSSVSSHPSAFRQNRRYSLEITSLDGGHVLNKGKTSARRYLLVALWPACEVAIAAATVNAARRASGDSVTGAGRHKIAGRKLGDALPGLLSGAMQVGSAPVRSGRLSELDKGTARRALPSPVTLPDWVPDLLWLGAVSCTGGAVAYEVMRLLGPAVVNHGPKIDEPIARWTADHQVKRWASVMERFTKIGNTWTTWGAAGTAAVSLAVTWPEHKWLPPAVLGSAAVVDHYVTLALRRKVGRPGPPGSPGGTYPCGGVDRVVLFYGLIAYLLWREFSGSPQGKSWAVGTVAALSLNEAYSREYLSKHWFTDILSGLVYGVVLLAPFIAAVRLIAGPAVRPGQSGTC